jgi:hypothetical protein
MHDANECTDNYIELNNDREKSTRWASAKKKKACYKASAFLVHYVSTHIKHTMALGVNQQKSPPGDLGKARVKAIS